MKVITRQEANLTTWLLSQISLLEQQSGKQVQSLDLAYAPDGNVSVDLVFVGDTAA